MNTPTESLNRLLAPLQPLRARHCHLLCTSPPPDPRSACRGLLVWMGPHCRHAVCWDGEGLTGVSTISWPPFSLQSLQLHMLLYQRVSKIGARTFFHGFLSCTVLLKPCGGSGRISSPSKTLPRSVEMCKRMRLHCGWNLPLTKFAGPRPHACTSIGPQSLVKQPRDAR